MANPTLLKTPIASGGDKNTIPETTGSTTGLLSQEKGWQQINSLPINAGGIAPSRLDFNGVFNLLSNILFYTQKGWQWEFDETQNYFAGCTVKDTADGKTYVCIADVNASTTHPSSDTAHWKLSDLATKGDLANYLPLAGGQMTGKKIGRDVDNSNINLYGGTINNGASVGLNGPSASAEAGAFYIVAKDTVNNKLLKGLPDGTLTWAGANVLTDSNGGYLPLSGGTMTGTYITRSTDTSELVLIGGSSGSTGALLQLNGSNRSAGPGRFELQASNGTSTALLQGNTNGTLNWVGNDLASASIVAKSLGKTGYIKRADGLIEQWGQIDTAGTATQQINFPISFNSSLFSIVITREYITSGQPLEGNLMLIRRNNLSSFIVDTSEAGSFPMDWIAVGM